MNDKTFAALAWLLHLPGGVWATVEKKGELSVHHGRQSLIWGVISIILIVLFKYIPKFVFQFYPNPDFIYWLGVIGAYMFLLTYFVNLYGALGALGAKKSKIPLAYGLSIRLFGVVMGDQVKGDIVVLKEKPWLKQLRHTLFKAGLSPNQISNVLSHQLTQNDVKHRLAMAGLDVDTVDEILAGHRESRQADLSLLTISLLWVLAFAVGFLFRYLLS